MSKNFVFGLMCVGLIGGWLIPYDHVTAAYDNRVIVENIDNANFAITIDTDCNNTMDYLSVYAKNNDFNEITTVVSPQYGMIGWKYIDDFRFVDLRNPKGIYALFNKQAFRNKNITLEITGLSKKNIGCNDRSIQGYAFDVTVATNGDVSVTPNYKGLINFNSNPLEVRPNSVSSLIRSQIPTNEPSAQTVASTDTQTLGGAIITTSTIPTGASTKIISSNGIARAIQAGSISFTDLALGEELITSRTTYTHTGGLTTIDLPLKPADPLLRTLLLDMPAQITAPVFTPTVTRFNKNNLPPTGTIPVRTVTARECTALATRVGAIEAATAGYTYTAVSTTPGVTSIPLTASKYTASCTSSSNTIIATLNLTPLQGGNRKIVTVGSAIAINTNNTPLIRTNANKVAYDLFQTKSKVGPSAVFGYTPSGMVMATPTKTSALSIPTTQKLISLPSLPLETISPIVEKILSIEPTTNTDPVTQSPVSKTLFQSFLNDL